LEGNVRRSPQGDERILRVNRESARRINLAEPYAESFEIEE